MSNTGMEFADRVGHELYELLRQRITEQLSREQNFDRYTAAMGAALINVAEVLRDPMEKGADPEKLIAFASRWLKTLLEQIRHP